MKHEPLLFERQTAINRNDDGLAMKYDSFALNVRVQQPVIKWRTAINRETRNNAKGSVPIHRTFHNKHDEIYQLYKLKHAHNIKAKVGILR